MTSDEKKEPARLRRQVKVLREDKQILIDAEKDHHDVSLPARVLGVSRQGYYAWITRGSSGAGPPGSGAHREDP